MKRPARVLSVVGVLLLLLGACAEDEYGPSSVQINWIDMGVRYELVVGDTTHYNAIVWGCSNSFFATCDIPITWSSSTPAVATVSQDGVVIARSAGLTRISATAGGKTDSKTVTVIDRPNKASKSITIACRLNTIDWPRQRRLA